MGIGSNEPQMGESNFGRCTKPPKLKRKHEVIAFLAI